MSKWAKKTAKIYHGGKHAMQLFKGVRATWKKYKATVRKSKPKSVYIKQKKSPKVVGRGLAGESTNLIITYKKPKANTYNIVKTIGNEDTYVIDETNAATSDAGVQSVGSFALLNKTSDLAQLLSATQEFWNSTTGTIVDAGGLGAGYRVSKFFLRQITCNMQITNQTPGITNMTIYTVMSKVTKPTIVYPETDWANGNADQSPTASTSANSNYVGAKPFESKLFNMNWKVKQMRHIQLMGGQTHNHNITFNINRFLDTEYINTYAQIRGVSLCVFIVLWGQPADINNGHTSAGANVTVTPTKVVGIQTRTYKYQFCNTFPKQTYHATTNLLQEPLSHVYVINEESGGVTDLQDQTVNTAYA